MTSTVASMESWFSNLASSPLTIGSPRKMRKLQTKDVSEMEQSIWGNSEQLAKVARLMMAGAAYREAVKIVVGGSSPSSKSSL
mmetsp:Transcript_64349/g.112273  ORF Transcript_64349/g.112273 Transcript_64349/m.112273 type:complete len:83 (-) Transcript_64349:108-356(-)